MQKQWVVYMLKCRGGVLYTGVSNDLSKRIETHNKGKGGAFTRQHMPCMLAWHERCANRSRAQKKECEIKKFSREKKLSLIKQYLSECKKA